MSQMPSMPVFPDALMSDTADLSTEEFGAYCLILFATWRNNGRPFPDEDARLARIARMSKGRWTGRIRDVIAKFFDLSDGVWRQKRLEKEWNYCAEKAAISRENGAHGGRPKSLKDNESENPAGFLQEPALTLTHTPLESPNGLSRSSAAKRARELESEFEKIWPLFPKRKDKGHALKAFIAARKSTSLDLIEAGINRFRHESEGIETQYIAYPGSWLNGKGWLDEETAQTNGHTNGHSSFYDGPTEPPPEIEGFEVRVVRPH